MTSSKNNPQTRAGLICHPLPDGLAAGAVSLLALLSDILLKTLNALHLVIAKEIYAESLVTADHIMADGDKALGLNVVRF
jgi:hypothetical protein